MRRMMIGSRQRKRAFALSLVWAFQFFVFLNISGSQPAGCQSLEKAQSAAESLKGDWDSEWGTVTLEAVAQRDGYVALKGYWIQQGNKGLVTKGKYDPLTGLLTFSYYQDWSNVTGAAALKASRDFQVLQGNWDQSNGSRGKWTLQRSKAANSSVTDKSSILNAHDNVAASSQSQNSATIAAQITTEVQKLSDTLRQDSSNKRALVNRAIRYLALGEVSSAGNDAGKVLQLLPTVSNQEDEHIQQLAVIVLLLTYMKSEDKNSQNQLLKQAESKCDHSVWPYPIIIYLGGGTSERQLYSGSNAQQAEAAFFQGMSYMCLSMFSEAKATFKRAVSLPHVADRLVSYQELSRQMLGILGG